MKYLSIVTSILLFILILFQPLILKNSYTKFENLILGKSIYINLVLFVFFLSYFSFFIYISKNKDLLFSFLTILCAILLLLLFIISLNLPFFNLRTNLKVIYYLLIFIFIFNSLLILISAIFHKINSYLFLMIYRFLLFIVVLFNFLQFLGNPSYEIIYQYIILFSIAIYRIIINFTFIEKRT